MRFTSMHAFLLISNSVPSGEEALNILNKDSEEVVFFNVKTIDEVRTLKKFFLFPPQKPTTIVLTELGDAKNEAQNSLLKLLEEPPSTFITFLIVCPSEALLLSTIFSRVSVIKNKEKSELPGKDETDQKTMSLYDIVKINDRDEALSALSTVGSEASLEAIASLKKNGSVALHLANFMLATQLHTG